MPPQKPGGMVAVDPRACGVNMSVASYGAQYSGRSPRMRGKPVLE